jgi:hypothetical protein
MAVPQTLEVRLEIAKAIRALLYPGIMQKFDSDQPRVPAGNPDGGQWTSGGAGRNADVTAHPIVSAARSRQSEVECNAQLATDAVVCNALHSRPCWAQARQRYAACLGGHQIPPLSF